MKATIVPIGNSKGVRIPKVLLTKSELPEEVELTAKRGEIRIVPAAQDTPKLRVNEEALLSEKALVDWLRQEEDEAWKSLQ